MKKVTYNCLGKYYETWFADKIIIGEWNEKYIHKCSFQEFRYYMRKDIRAYTNALGLYMDPSLADTYSTDTDSLHCKMLLDGMMMYMHKNSSITEGDINVYYV